MNSQLQAIIQLQELDNRIAALQAAIAALPLHLRDIEKQLNDITEANLAATNRIAANQQQRRQFDADIQALEQKISKYNNQLLDVKTNEEYKALLHEIEFSKAEIRKTEDKILELMIAADGDEKRLRETGEEFKRQQQQVAQEQREAEAVSRQKQKELDVLLVERQHLQAGVGDTLMDLYNRISKLRNGIVVAEVKDQICTVCHVMIRPQTYNEVMRNSEIIQCSNCGRIQYWVPATEGPPPSPSPNAEVAP